MLRNRIYYGLKPFIPQSFRTAIRRKVALRLRHRIGSVWPIAPGSERRPQDWPGWPGNKKFALVLTHDVESAVGLRKCRELMQLEMDAGFRSSFNFVPEGDYRLPPELREELAQNGFEIGIHDLKHDGRLYQSRREFSQRAQRINHYLAEWGAVGFRSAFMLHELDWLHELNIQYDASTFDTDPFEPQPEGYHTIFPLWIPRFSPPSGKADRSSRNSLSRNCGDQLSTVSSSRGGYIELPYTLPQDSTLFVLLQEKTPAIWLRKLDWIAQHGGMALVLTHPDYMISSGSHRKSGDYPIELYRQLLDYIQDKYSGDYWFALPKEIAAYARQIMSRPVAGLNGARPEQLLAYRQETGSNITDQKYAAADNKWRLRGKRAAVLLFSYYPADPRPRRAAEALVMEGVTVDLVFSALVPKAFGDKVILDLHAPVPELMQTIFELPEKSFSVRLLKRLEKWSIGFADLVLTVNLACKKIYTSRSCPPEKINVVLNSREDDIFRFQAPQSRNANGENSAKPFVILYHGSLVPRNGFDLAVNALETARKSVPTATLMVCGERSEFFEGVMDSVRKRGLQENVEYLGVKNRRQIVEAINNCDLGIIPNHRNTFTEINTPTRIFEYLALGKPVIAPKANGIQDHLGDNDL